MTYCSCSLSFPTGGTSVSTCALGTLWKSLGCHTVSGDLGVQLEELLNTDTIVLISPAAGKFNLAGFILLKRLPFLHPEVPSVSPLTKPAAVMAQSLASLIAASPRAFRRTMAAALLLATPSCIPDPARAVPNDLERRGSSAGGYRPFITCWH